MLKKHRFFNVFATSAMSCCSKKSLKIVPTSSQKQLPNHYSNLHRSWIQLGSILGGFWGAKLEPSWYNIAQKWIQKMIKNDHHLDGFQIDFWSILAPTWGVQGGSNYQLLEVFVSSWGHLGLKMVPYGPQTPPRRPKALILKDLGLYNTGFWVPTCMILLLP